MQGKAMRMYWEIAIRSIKRAAQYRASLLNGIVTNAFFGILRCYIYIALYKSGGPTNGFTLEQAISYTWITQSLISVGGAWISNEIMKTIASGEVAIDLARPMSYQAYWFSRYSAERFFNLFVRGIFTYLVGMLFFKSHIPTLEQAVLFFIAISFAIAASFALEFLSSLSAFWMMDTTGVLLVVNSFLMFFSGFLVPLAFFPNWLFRISQWLPFQAITSIPARIFLGKVASSDIPGVIALQVFWCALMLISGALVLKSAVRKLVVQGG